MALAWWWMVLLLLALLGLGYYLYYKFGRSVKPVKRGVPIAHSERLAALPSYAKVIGLYRRYVWALLVVCGLAVVSAILLAARPVNIQLTSPAEKNRDIMLCLDVSGSVTGTDAKLFSKFIELTDTFAGQRIGLTIFDSSPITIFPLTDDYQLVHNQLETGYQAFVNIGTTADGSVDIGHASGAQLQRYNDFIAGTASNDNAGSSLVGDGLASCVMSMGNNGQHRSQSIILATDNQTAGTPIIDTTSAAALAKQKGIRVYAVDPSTSTTYDYEVTDRSQLKAAALSTGGNYYQLNGLSIQDIINSISKQEATFLPTAPQLVKNDTPLPMTIVLSLLVAAMLFITWRLRR